MHPIYNFLCKGTFFFFFKAMVKKCWLCLYCTSRWYCIVFSFMVSVQIFWNCSFIYKMGRSVILSSRMSGTKFFLNLRLQEQNGKYKHILNLHGFLQEQNGKHTTLLNPSLLTEWQAKTFSEPVFFESDWQAKTFSEPVFF